MKKSTLKLAIRKAMIHYYKGGMTNTAKNVEESICKSIDRAYKLKHRKK